MLTTAIPVFIATVVLGVVIRAAPNGAVYVGKEPLGAAMGTFAIANIALMLGMCFGVFKIWYSLTSVSYTHLTLPTNREV